MSYQEVILRENFKYIEENWTIDAEVEEFSNTNIHNPGGESEVSRYVENMYFVMNQHTPEGSVPGRTPSFEPDELLSHLGEIMCWVIVYPNGRDSSTEGHVSLEFFIELDFLSPFCFFQPCVEMAWSVAVVDKEGCRRFPQSFAYWEALKSEEQQQSAIFFFDNYISRDFLLRAADELLPEDTLTVQMDGVVKVYMGDPKKDIGPYDDLELRQSLRTEEGIDDDGISRKLRYLLLDSEVGKLLRREAKYFDRLYATPMAEKNLGCVKIRDEEFDTFRRTVQILWPTEIEHRFKLQQIFDVYAFADYYGIEYLLETCRRWLKLVCRTSDHASEVFWLADWYNDTLLHRIADGILAMIEKEIDGYDLGRPYPDDPDEEWEYTPVDEKLRVDYDTPDVSTDFTFIRRIKFKENEDIPDISNSYI